jgi:hypothetical protein
MQFYSGAFEAISTRLELIGKMNLPLIGRRCNFDGNRVYRDVQVLVTFYQKVASSKPG